MCNGKLKDHTMIEMEDMGRTDDKEEVNGCTVLSSDDMVSLGYHASLKRKHDFKLFFGGTPPRCKGSHM